MREFYRNLREHGLREALKQDYALTRERHPAITDVLDAYVACPREAAFSTLMLSLGICVAAIGLDTLIQGDSVGPPCALMGELSIALTMLQSGDWAMRQQEERKAFDAIYRISPRYHR